MDYGVQEYLRSDIQILNLRLGCAVQSESQFSCRHANTIAKGIEFIVNLRFSYLIPSFLLTNITLFHPTSFHRGSCLSELLTSNL